MRSWLVLPSRMRLRTANVAVSTSNAGDPAAADAGEQALGDDARERAGELDPDLRLLVAREHVDDAVEGLAGVVRVQRGEHEVAGLGDRERGLDRLGVAHLADEQDVGVLPEGRSQRPLERVAVDADLALVDRRPLVAVHVLDRVLDGDDVARVALVDLVDHRGERRRLARTGRAGDEHEALREIDPARHDRR